MNITFDRARSVAPCPLSEHTEVNQASWSFTNTCLREKESQEDSEYETSVVFCAISILLGLSMENALLFFRETTASALAHFSFLPLCCWILRNAVCPATQRHAIGCFYAWL